MNDMRRQAPTARPLSGREIAYDAPDDVLAEIRARTAAHYGVTIPDDAIVFHQGGRLAASMPGLHVALRNASGHLNYEVPDAPATTNGRGRAA